MVYVDIEGTVIDDLFEMNWLTDNIEKIKPHIKEEFGIFTFGWMHQSEVDKNFVKLLETKFNAKCVKIYTKSECMLSMYNRKKWFWNESDMFSSEAEISFNEKFNKENCFIEMEKDNCSTLIDDSIEESKIITFIDIGKTVALISIQKFLIIQI